MTETKPLDAIAIINEVLDHILIVEEENFYYRSALGFAKANPPTYDQMIQEFEQCLAIVQRVPESFDPVSAFAPYGRLRELVQQLSHPESQQSA